MAKKNFNNKKRDEGYVKISGDFTNLLSNIGYSVPEKKD